MRSLIGPKLAGELDAVTTVLCREEHRVLRVRQLELVLHGNDWRDAPPFPSSSRVSRPGGFVAAAASMSTTTASIAPRFLGWLGILRARGAPRVRRSASRERHSFNEKRVNERRTPVTLFTVQLEIGPETRAMIERVAANAVMHVELGPKTREMIKALRPSDSNEEDEGEGLLRKGVDAALRK